MDAMGTFCRIIFLYIFLIYSIGKKDEYKSYNFISKKNEYKNYNNTNIITIC
jgi:hypothetical protein